MIIFILNAGCPRDWRWRPSASGQEYWGR